MSCKNVECRQGRSCTCGEQPYRLNDLVILLIGALALIVIFATS